jgi:acyl-CoA synthetase (AMP-forming)/AMP-acid ligase II
VALGAAAGGREVRFDARWEPVTSESRVALSGESATVQQLMDAVTAAFGDREAYVDGDQRVTFGQWLARADLLAAEFVRRGVRRGDVVALMLPASVDYAVCYAAAAKAGATTTGLNTRVGRREVDAILRRCSPALVVRDASLELPDVPAGTSVLARSELAAICRGAADGALVAAAREALAAVQAECEPADILTIMWTSGTTGLPKGACFDHANLRAISAAAGAMCAPGDRRLGALPFAHAGYMGRLWDQLEKGITLVICSPSLPPADMLRLVASERITVFGAVPTQWERLLRLPDVDDVDLSRVRIGTSASAPIRPEVVKEIAERLGFPVIVRYAMTESPTITGTEPTDPPDVQFRTVGRPQQGMEVSVPGPPGEVGQIRVRGGCVMRGYWNEPGLTAAAFDAEGWLVSGDLGYLREDGNLTIVGRATDMYIRGGYNVYPAEVEAVLALHPQVASVSVAGVPAPRIGEIGVAFVVPADPEKPPTLEELREIVRIELADYKAPDRLEIVDRLPVNAMMKVDKNALRALASVSAAGGAA